ncbi:MAG: HAE1 family hydrophobic/amphiphilic exporter-1, partial [Pirellulaceae bacterium]
RQGNSVVRIDDVAKVVDGHERRREMTRTNGEPAVMVYIFRQAGANTIQVSDRVREAVVEINQDLRSAHVTLRTDRSEFIRQAVGNVKSSAIYGMSLAVVILVLFLRSFRSSLVISISMPLSVLATFIAMYFMGFTLNVVSFGGLALGIGMLVDNSIVVLESVFRKRNDGVDPRTAAIEGTAEVSSAIVASTLTTLIVFIPMLFIHGITGLLLHQLAWVVSISLVCSLFASLTLTPMLTTLWSESSDNTAPHSAVANWFHSLTGSVFAGFEWCYAKLFDLSLRFTGVVMFALLLCFSCVVGLFPFVGAEFLPATDEGNLYINCEMAAGIQLPMLARQSELLEQRVFELVPERRVTAAFIGDGADDGEDWHKSRLRVQLVPRSQRKRSIDEIRKDLEENLGVVPGTKTSVRVSNDSMLFRSYGGNEAAIEVVVRGHNSKQAVEFSEAIQQQMGLVAGLVNVEVERAQERPIVVAKIDRAKAGLQGVSVRDIAQTLETTIRGAEATVFREDGDEYNILVQLQETDRNQQRDVNLLGVSTADGAIVPLQSIVDFKQQLAPVAINRADQQRMTVVSADVEDRDLNSAVKELNSRLQELEVPLGFSYQITGDWEQQQESFNALLQGLILAILLMYMVMASQFESLRDPVVILVAVPLGAIGVILVFVTTETTLNVQSFIGVIMLAGIVVNNAIVLVDYMNQLVHNNPDLPIDEIVRQASVRRFRPIIMTTLTTVLAMLPIALGVGEGGELQAPLARVVIGGLMTGTLTTLFAIPLIYRAVHGSSKPQAVSGR